MPLLLFVDFCLAFRFMIRRMRPHLTNYIVLLTVNLATGWREMVSHVTNNYLLIVLSFDTPVEPAALPERVRVLFYRPLKVVGCQAVVRQVLVATGDQVMDEFHHIVAKPWIERLKRVDPDTQKAFDLDRQVCFAVAYRVVCVLTQSLQPHSCVHRGPFPSDLIDFAFAIVSSLCC